jgi:hypothetical protein
VVAADDIMAYEKEVIDETKKWRSLDFSIC